MILIDTNVILRYLLNDIEQQNEIASEIIRKGAYTQSEIIAEVVYVLTKLYRVPRNEICNIISPLFDEVSIMDEHIIQYALNVYSESNFDFVDCILIARKELLGETIFTFDKKLTNRLNKM